LNFFLLWLFFFGTAAGFFFGTAAAGFFGAAAAGFLGTAALFAGIAAQFLFFFGTAARFYGTAATTDGATTRIFWRWRRNFAATYQYKKPAKKQCAG